MNIYKKNKCLLASVTILSSAVFMGGCFDPGKPELTFTPPKYIEQQPAKEEEERFPNLGSIYSTSKGAMFSDRRAMHVNDILTVVISENVNSTLSSSRNLAETDAMTLNGPTVNNGQLTGKNLIGQGLSKIGKYSSPSINLQGGTTAYTGSGSDTKTAKFTTTISARIIKVLENDTYFIDGERAFMIDGQKQSVRVSGVVRSADIKSNNTIESSLIANAKILYKTDGSIKQSTEEGWGTRAIKNIWPF